MTALATYEDLTSRFDERSIRDLVSDTGDPTEALEACPIVTTLLESASGQILAAALAGNNYTEAELTALTGNAAALVKEMVCRLAVGGLMRRRIGRFRPEEIEAIEQSAIEWCTQLRQGKQLLPILAHQEASLPTIDGPTAVDYDRLNMITTRTRNFYPAVATRLPRGRQ